MTLSTITALPTAPSRTDAPATFNALADAWVDSLDTFTSEMNTVIGQIPTVVNGIDYNGTSTTSVLIGTGAKSFTTQTGKNFQIGQSVRVAYTATPANYMDGQVTAYNSGTGAIDVLVTAVGGAGTFAVWTISLAVAGGGSYATTAALAASTGAALVGTIATGTGVTARTVQDKLRDTVNVKDFGAVGDGVADDTAEIAAAIAAASTAGGGDISLGEGTFKITSTLTLPGNITLIGVGGGRVSQPVSAAPTRLLWAGGASEVVKIGWQSDTVAGGGLKHLRIDGDALATRCVSIKDHQHGKFEGLVLTGATSDALYFTNTDGRDPTGFSLFEDLQIALRGGATNSANGIYFDGVGTGTSGVTLCTFIRPRIEHANGAGVKINLRGDAMTWVQPQIFRADVETGIGVWSSSTVATQVTSAWAFISPIISSGIRIDQSGAALGWNIFSADDVDVNSGFTRFVYGKGADDVLIEGSFTGRLGGPAKTLGWRDAIIHDPMNFMRWDSGNSILHTGAGNWKTGGTPAAIADAAQVGGAIVLTTNNVTNSEAWIRLTPDFTSGVTLATHFPSLNMAIAPLTLTNVLVRFGMLGDFSASPGNGAFVQFDPSVSANFIATCASASAVTSVDTGVVAAIARTQWRIEATEGAVNFFYRTGSNRLWALGASIDTNISAAALSPTFYVKTKANAFADIQAYDVKYSHLGE